jgi:hypothetical protein
MMSVCDGDEQCMYDAKAMGSLEIGENTKNNHRYYKLLHEMQKPGYLFLSKELEISKKVISILFLF